MAKKKDLTPEDHERVIALLKDAKHDVRALIEALQAKQRRSPQPE
jgi:hypothetical protein